MCATPPAATGSPRWRYRMWAACGFVTVVTAVLLGLDIAASRGATPLPSGILDWSLAGFALAIVIPAAEWLVRHHVAGVRAELARINRRLDDRDDRDGTLIVEIAALRESVDLMRGEYAERLDAEMLRGTQAALDDLAGGSVRALPQRVPTPRHPSGGRRQQAP